jgi:hypothetical protein
VAGEWRKLHNEELQDLYCSPSIIRIIKARRMRWAGHLARMGEKRNAYRLLVEKPGGSRPLRRQGRRWLDNIRIDLLEVGWGDVDWIGLAQDRDGWRALVNSVLNLRLPRNAGKLSSVQTTRDLSSSARLHGVSYYLTATMSPAGHIEHHSQANIVYTGNPVLQEICVAEVTSIEARLSASCSM